MMQFSKRLKMVVVFGQNIKVRFFEIELNSIEYFLLVDGRKVLQIKRLSDGNFKKTEMTQKIGSDQTWSGIP